MEDASIKLIHCTVTNRDNVSSARWIERPFFKLWHYMMTTKHGMRVDDPLACLWMGHKYYSQRENILSHSGESLNVDCIQLSIFDEADGFLEHTTRFVLREEALKHKDLLMGHLSDEIKKEASFEVQIYAGVCMTRYGSESHLELDLDDDF
ncbi:MAG: hypothetical protein ACI8XX_002603 [Polaribacter sp.]|jgi:hypothetical protein